MARTPKGKHPSALPITGPVETETATSVVSLRHQLNRMPPCVVMAMDVSGLGFKVLVMLDQQAPETIRIDLNADGRPITAANIAAALGQRDVANAAAELIEVAAGRSSQSILSLISQITGVVFGQVSRYRLNRPDLRLPCEGGRYGA